MQQKGGTELAPPAIAAAQAAFLRLEVLLLRPDELLRRDEEAPRPVVVALARVLPRPEEDELLRPDEMLRVFELPEPVLRDELAEVRLEELLLRPLACSSSG